MPSFGRALLAALALALVAGCGEQRTDAPSEPPLGAWRAWLELPGGRAPFGLELGRDGAGHRATLINGQERVRVPEAAVADGRVTLTFPAYNNRIEAEWAEGRLTGTLTLVKRYGKEQRIPFAAVPGTAAPSQPQATAEVDVSGRWEVSFTEPDGNQHPAVGEFAQRGNRLFGTFLTETGDYRYLEGTVRGREVTLSKFDGAHAFLFKAVEEDGRLTGRFWSGTEWQETWSAVRNPRATLADARRLTFLKPGYERFTFTFPDTDGEPVSLDDERFRGKVVVVTLAGSWCPNCHDEAAFMAPLYERLRGQGLEVVALMYEHLEDFDAAAAQVEKFRQKFGIEYTTLIAGISDKTEAGKTLPALNHVLAFPTTIFIGRGGRVRQIHTGFQGPGTGEHYEQLTREMTAFIEDLLAESVPAVEDAA